MYSRVTSYCDWIDKETNGEAKCVEAVPESEIF